MPTNALGWSWKDAESIAIQNNLGLKSTKESIDISSLGLKSAKSFHLPDLFVTGAARKFDDEDGLGHLYRGGLRFRLPLFSGGSVVQGTAIARERKKQVGSTYRVGKIRVLVDLRLAFIEIVYVRKLVELSERIVSQRKENLEFVKLRYDSGLEFKWVYLSSRAKLDQAKLRLIDAQVSEGPALAALEDILGVLPIESMNEVEETDFYQDPTNYKLEPLLTNVTSHPEILRKLSEVREAEYEIKRSKSVYWPTIAFQGDVAVIDTDDDPVFPFWAVGGVLNMPLFEGGRNVRDVEISRKRRLQSNLSAKQLVLSLKAKIKRAHKNHLLARERIDVSHANFEASNDRAKVVRQQYRTGLIKFLNFERAQDDWVRAEEGYLNAKRNLHQSRARLEAEIGVELGS